jgi:hypothetical protein
MPPFFSLLKRLISSITQNTNNPDRPPWLCLRSALETHRQKRDASTYQKYLEGKGQALGECSPRFPRRIPRDRWQYAERPLAPKAWQAPPRMEALAGAFYGGVPWATDLETSQKSAKIAPPLSAAKNLLHHRDKGAHGHNLILGDAAKDWQRR